MWIIDFEASGLSRQSYPIEVGLTDGDTHYQALIKPLAHWQYWSDDSEAVHQISRAKLEAEGLAPIEVARDLNEKLDGCTVYCDAVQYDGFWCNLLYGDNGVRCKFELRDINDFDLSSRNRLAAYLAERYRLENSGAFTMHRALDDAQIIQQALEFALKL